MLHECHLPFASHPTAHYAGGEAAQHGTPVVHHLDANATNVNVTFYMVGLPKQGTLNMVTQPVYSLNPNPKNDSPP